MTIMKRYRQLSLACRLKLRNYSVGTAVPHKMYWSIAMPGRGCAFPPVRYAPLSAARVCMDAFASGLMPGINCKDWKESTSEGKFSILAPALLSVEKAYVQCLAPVVIFSQP